MATNPPNLLRIRDKLLARKVASAEYFPDNDSQREGYQLAVEELLIDLNRALRVETPPEDIVRVLRIYEFTGPRTEVEAQIAKSIHGERTFGAHPKCLIRAATLGTYPEIFNAEQPTDGADPGGTNPSS